MHTGWKVMRRSGGGDRTTRNRVTMEQARQKGKSGPEEGEAVAFHKRIVWCVRDDPVISSFLRLCGRALARPRSWISTLYSSVRFRRTAQYAKGLAQGGVRLADLQTDA